MKLNKKRMLGLSLGLVLVLLVIGCFASNSVDYEKAEEDIDVICAARVQSYKLINEYVDFATKYALGEEVYAKDIKEEMNEAIEYKAQLAEVDLENLKKYCENEDYDYEFYRITYNQILRTYCYCTNEFEKIDEDPLGTVIEFVMLKTIVTRDYWTDELRDNAETYDKEFGFVEYK